MKNHERKVLVNFEIFKSLSHLAILNQKLSQLTSQGHLTVTDAVKRNILPIESKSQPFNKKSHNHSRLRLPTRPTIQS